MLPLLCQQQTCNQQNVLKKTIFNKLQTVIFKRFTVLPRNVYSSQTCIYPGRKLVIMKTLFGLFFGVWGLRSRALKLKLNENISGK